MADTGVQIFAGIAKHTKNCLHIGANAGKPNCCLKSFFTYMYIHFVKSKPDVFEGILVGLVSISTAILFGMYTTLSEREVNVP